MGSNDEKGSAERASDGVEGMTEGRNNGGAGNKNNNELDKDKMHEMAGREGNRAKMGVPEIGEDGFDNDIKKGKGDNNNKMWNGDGGDDVDGEKKESLTMPG